MTQRFNYVEFATELIAPAPYTATPSFPPPGLTPLRKPISESTSTIESDFPLGATLGRPHDAAMERDVLRFGLAAAELSTFGPPWRSAMNPLPWNDTGDRSWEEDTRNLYRNDDDDTLQAHQSDHNDKGDVLAGNERAFMQNHRI